MSRKIIVSLASDQTIPNILFIKEKGFADYYYFISTEKMQTRNIVRNTVNSLGIEDDKFKTIVVVEDSISDIDEKLLAHLAIEDDDEICVNITGGTKIMSLGVYNYFTRIGAGEIFYIPIGKNEIKQIFPLRKSRITIIKQRLSLLEYLTAYGVQVNQKSFEQKNTLHKEIKETNCLFNAFISDKRIDLFHAAQAVRELGKRGKVIDKNIAGDQSLFEQVQIFNKSGISWSEENKVSRDETKYITGEWFEEYVYPIIKETLQKSDAEIAIGLQLVKGDAPNEYDIMFTHNNSFYVIECKTDVADNEEGKINYLFTNTLYKAATLKKEFGLWVNYYLFALNDFTTLTEVQKKRAKQLDIKLVGLEILADENNFISFIQKM